MYNKFEIKYNPRKINSFYTSLNINEALEISQKRKKYIRNLVEKNKIYFRMDTTNKASLATSTAVKLFNNFEKYNLENTAEAAYFYTMMVDPDFEFLKLFNSTSDKLELKNKCIMNFGYYDNFLIYLEAMYMIKNERKNDSPSKEIIDKFYRNHKYNHFINLNLDRITYINGLAIKEAKEFIKCNSSFLERAFTAALKLENESYNLKDNDELLYLFIKLVDPNFQLLEAYESISNIKELRTECIYNFGYYDGILLHLEKEINNRFNLYNLDELWARESIKRTRKRYF